MTKKEVARSLHFYFKENMVYVTAFEIVELIDYLDKDLKFKAGEMSGSDIRLINEEEEWIDKEYFKED